jgi:natural product biosynthesis luciferase-like monooxygenase protein
VSTLATPSAVVDCEVEDASRLDAAALRQRMEALADRPFDLQAGPLFRVHLLTRGAGEQILLLVFHHLVCDFWSLAIVARDLGTLYAAEADGRTAMLPELPAEYADHVAAQKTLLEGPEGERLWDYWRAELAGPLPVLELPTDRPRPVAQTYRGDAEALPLEASLVAQLKTVSRAAGVTPYTVMLAAFQLLLSRYAGSADVVVGSPVSGRTDAAFGDVVGYFVNPVVLRARPDRHRSAAQFIGDVQARVAGALAHQAMPFALLTERLEPIRDPSRTPVFQSMFVYQQTPALAGAPLALFSLGIPGARLMLGGVVAESMAFVHRVSQFDLTLAVAESDGTLYASLQYNTDLFDAPTVRQMLDHFTQILGAMVAEPARRLGLVPMLGPAERQHLLADFNDTAVAMPPETADACIHALVEQQAARTPDATALIADGEEIGYAELNRRANRLARRLRAVGVGPDVPVGLCVERSSTMLVGLLGILKAGGAYVPLDPAYPAARLQFMLSDSAAPVLVTGRRSGAPILDAARTRGCTVVDVDRDRDAIRRESDADLDATSAPANLAYVIYTSGSTGTPKGVMVAHRSVVNFFAGMDRAVGCGPSDTLLAVTSMSFDISVLELLWTLARGARIVLAADDVAQPGRRAPERAAPASIDYSLFYFASDSPGTTAERYRLVVEGAKFADRRRFSAVWTPERHFHEFGGLYPNPAVLGAALSTVTERIQIRAGSVVLPLHNPIRVVEEWSVIDNLSQGRVGLAFASGWHADDFVFFPDRYKDRKAITYRHMDLVRRLWAGEPITVQSGSGADVTVRTRPRPVQATLPVWITAAGGLETFIEAGRSGAGILTHLLGQTTTEVAGKIRAYREARAANGHDPATGHVTLMLHTFVGSNRDAVRETVREPFIRYLRSSVSLIDNLIRTLNLPVTISAMNPRDLDDLLQFAFDRYFETSALFGSPDDCLAIAAGVRDIGVDEIACLVDFGVSTDLALEHLHDLAGLTDRSAPRAHAVEEVSLASLAQRYRPTLMQCTPSFMRLFGDSPTLASLGSLRVLLLGGETLPPALVDDLRAHLACRIVNVYGPTETTVWSSSHDVGVASGAVPIGRPIANTSLYVLDESAQPVPAGVAGELYIGGEGVTRGYFKRPSLTANRFVADPFSARPGGRLYRTGDLVRHRRDGTIEFIGRTDSQVKLRGHRIELQEVEAVFASHASVGRAVAVVQDELGAGARLVAYVVAAEGATLDAQSLRDYAADRLPAYMVPSIVNAVTELPMTSNGKIDRRRLSAAPSAASAGDSGPVEPRGHLEETIAEVWQRVLQVEHVGVNDNFFDRGGHSLLVVSVQQQLEPLVGHEIPLIKLLQHPTVGSLARYLRREQVDTLLVDSTERAQRQRRSRRRARAI